MTPRNILAVALTLAGAPWWAHGAAPADAARQVFARVAPSVVTVRVLDAQGQADGHGSGVVVAAGQVATNCHVVRSAAALRVDDAGTEHAAEWTRQLPGIDLCLLAVSGLKAPAVALRAEPPLVVGEPVHAVGNPLGFGLAVSSGLLSSVEPGEPHARLAATAPVSPGSSGGGLFDDHGRLVGVTTAILGTGQNINLVLPADAVAQLLARGEPRATDAALPPPDRRWADEALALVVSGDAAGLQALAAAWGQAQPWSAPARVAQARAALLQARPADAEAMAREALALDGDLDSAWVQLGLALAAQQRPDEAEHALQQAERRNAGEAEVNLVRSAWLLARGQREAAREQLRLVVRKLPFNVHGWTELGRVEQALGQSDAAAQAFATAARLGGGQPTATPAATASRARALAALGWSELQRKRYVQAEAAFREGLAVQERDAVLWNGLGAVLHETRRWGEAEQAYTRSLALQPGDAGVLANRGEVHRLAKRPEQALADARAAVQAGPDHAAAQRLLGIMLRETRDFRGAAAAYARLAELNEPRPDDLVDWGESLLGAGDVPGAMAKLREADTQTPRSRRLNLVMARALGAQNDYHGALASVERALVDDPAEAIAWSSKGYALMQLGRLPEAATALETAVRLDPQLVNGWINLGEVQMRARNLGRAIEALELALSLQPRAQDARYYLALSYLNARLPLKTREHAEQLLAVQPGMAAAVELMAASYLSERRVDEARTWYLQLRQLAPAAAQRMRGRLLANGLEAARGWPE